MRYYHHVSFQDVVDSGKVTAEDLQKAIDEGKIVPIKQYSTGEEWIDGAAIHKVFGIDHFSHV